MERSPGEGSPHRPERSIRFPIRRSTTALERSVPWLPCVSLEQERRSGQAFLSDLQAGDRKPDGTAWTLSPPAPGGCVPYRPLKRAWETGAGEGASVPRCFPWRPGHRSRRCFPDQPFPGAAPIAQAPRNRPQECPRCHPVTPGRPLSTFRRRSRKRAAPRAGPGGPTSSRPGSLADRSCGSGEGLRGGAGPRLGDGSGTARPAPRR